MRLLIGEDFSPWTEKACWALDHEAMAYSFRQYQPMLDEPGLRLRTRNFTTKATVPVLFDGRAVFADSFSIARHAGGALFPERHRRDIEAWNDKSEAALRAGRALFLARLAKDPAAQLDNVPAFVPAPMRPLLRPLVRSGIAYLRFKHRAQDEAIARTELEGALRALREALGGSKYVLGQFSYADISMAVICQFIRPVDDGYIRLGAANRACWTEPVLARSFWDILDWRDALYTAHRRR